MKLAVGSFIVAVTSFNPLSVGIAALTFGNGAITSLLSLFPQRTISPKNEEPELDPGEFTIYRQAELNRTTASLLANGAILIVGEEGSGKSVLGNAVVERLTDDGFLVAFVEPTTPKQMLLEITQQFELPTEDIEPI